MRAVLIFLVLLQIVIAMQSSGLHRALAELTAFLLVVVIVVQHKKSRRLMVGQKKPSQGSH
ncbi:hypothetical protein [Vibrio sonorensis]|uniref:hypothetical protein n=1 Tax=Vibrio sonorensis TaxID=1004316 RepID=UPI0008DA0F35|nr:hypothetical protein [Vibrio sonorensis]